MSDLFDTSAVRDDPALWDELALRVAERAAREARPSGFEWLSHSRVGWTAASLLLAVALLSVLMRRERSAAIRLDVEWAQTLAPMDDIGKEIVRPNGPPAIGALLLRSRGGV